ncbi:DUF58 domain-containing protein [Amphibacillus indicireducens]|uniref:DUF58 domain-containing protein n=1 Tax=Amphibacillus indicireducens TaxID=1076330 RepID=A0ABP7W2S3_9BACI
MRQIIYLLMKTVVLFSLFLIFFSYAMFQGGFVSWFLFYLTLPILFYYLVFIFYPIKDWKVERVLEKNQLEAGQDIQIELNLNRHLPFPLSYLIIEDTLPRSMGGIFTRNGWPKLLAKRKLSQRNLTERAIFYPNFRRQLTYQYQLTELPRGFHSIESIRLTISDLFGFITKTIELPVQSTFSVLPASLELRLNLLNKSKLLGDQVSSTMHADRSSNMTGARQYTPGDRLSAIHWKATAKTDTLMTKEFDQEYNRDGAVILFGINNTIAYEWNVAMCYALLPRLKADNLQVEFNYIGADQMADSTKNSWANLADSFTALKPGATEMMVEASFDHYQQSFDRGNFLLIVTDQLTEKMVARLISLSVKHQRITVYVTQAKSDQTIGTRALEVELEQNRITVVTIDEDKTKQPRWVVTI